MSSPLSEKFVDVGQPILSKFWNGYHEAISDFPDVEDSFYVAETFLEFLCKNVLYRYFLLHKPQFRMYTMSKLAVAMHDMIKDMQDIDLDKQFDD